MTIPASKTISARQIDACIRELASMRAPKSICPSDVARSLAPENLRPLMQLVRARASYLAERGEVFVTQRGKVVDVSAARGPVRIVAAPASPTKYVAHYRGVDFRVHPERYRVGRGEEGVLIAEPYKSELLPLWRFRTPEVARASAAALWKAFTRYRKARDFVGMDMARKFLQMGFTRSRRYARHRSGRKYDQDGVEAPEQPDLQKDRSAAIFREAWDRAERDPAYRQWRHHQRRVS